MQLPCRRLRRPRRVFRHGPVASCSAPMASRSRRLSTARPGMPPRSPATRLGRHDSPGFDRGLCFVPSCSATFPKVSRSRRPAVCWMSLRTGFVAAWRIRRFAPAACNAATWRVRADGVHLPMRSAILAHRNRVAPRRRQPQATAAAPAGFPPGCPVSRSDRDGSRPTAPGRPQTAGNIHLAPMQHQTRMFSSLAAAGRNADLAPRHYRISATASHAAQQRCDVVRTRCSDGARRLAPQAYSRRGPAGHVAYNAGPWPPANTKRSRRALQPLGRRACSPTTSTTPSLCSPASI